MRTARRITRNTALLGLAEVISGALQFLIFVYAARTLGSEGFGIFNLAFSISMISLLFFDVGIFSLLIREIARRRESTDSYILNSAVIKAGLSGLILLGAVALVGVMGYRGETAAAVYAMVLFAMFNSFTQLFYAVFRAHERMGYDAALKVVRMALIAGAGYLVLSQGKGPAVLAVVFFSGELAVLLLAFAAKRLRFRKTEARLDIRLMKDILVKAWPFGLTLAFGSVYFYISAVILEAFRGAEEVGVFSASYNLAIAVLFVPNVYASAIYPVMSVLYLDSRKKLKRLFRRSVRYMYLLALPLAIGGFITAEGLITLIYGQEYQGAAIVLRIIMLFVFLKFLNFVIGFGLSAVDRQPERMRAMGIATAINIGLNLALIPQWGLVGAAIAASVGEIFLFLLYYSHARRYLCPVDFETFIIRPALSTAVMGAFLIYSPFAVATDIILSVPIYFAAMTLIGGFDEDDKKVLRRLIT